MKEKVIAQLKQVKQASYHLISIQEKQRDQILFNLAKSIRKNAQHIITENQKDLALMDKHDPRYDRLLLSSERIDSIASDIETVASLSWTKARILEEKCLPNGLKIQKTSVPLGVVAVIYESRPNVTVDVFALCFKSGNACVLKGGKEAWHSNQYFVSLINQTMQQHDIHEPVIYLLPPERAATEVLLKAHHLVDVCIPRGSQALINFVRQHAQIPIIETGAGIVHTYFDVSGDTQKGRDIVNNAKTRRVSVCNALDTLIMHEKRCSDLYTIVELLAEKNVALFADPKSYETLQTVYPKSLLTQADENSFGHEFLDYKMSIKTVSSIEEAIHHITQHSSGHSEAIIAEDQSAIAYFLDNVDAAVVYANASTAFTDGGQFGMGAEIGISTQKLHARGPMGLDALTSYKWVVKGCGQIRV